MDDWEKLSETTLAEKEDFYSQLNMEDNTEADYVKISKRKTQENIMICMSKVTDYCQLIHLKTLGNMCINIYQLDPAKFLSAPGLAWQAALKRLKVITNI